MAREPGPERRDDWRGSLRYAHLGIQFALIVGLLFYGGYLLDVKTGRSPLFVLLGLLGGFAVAMYHLLKELQHAERDNARSERSKDETEGR